MESMVRQRLREKRAQVYCADCLAKDLQQDPVEVRAAWPNWRSGRTSWPVAALVAAQVSPTAGSRERDGGHLVLGEARWRK
jgi:hypothetical protein